jgi:putative transposase
MEADVEGLIGAGRHERSGDRTTWRNGYRERALDTRLGMLNLKAPKLRQGSYFPGFPEARKTSDQALVAFAIVSRTNGVPMAHSRRRGSAVSPPAAWTSWCRRRG